MLTYSNLRFYVCMFFVLVIIILQQNRKTYIFAFQHCLFSGMCFLGTVFLGKLPFSSLHLYLIILSIQLAAWTSFSFLSAAATATTAPPSSIFLLLGFIAYISAFTVFTYSQLHRPAATSTTLPVRAPIVTLDTELRARNVQIYYIETFGFFSLFVFIYVFGDVLNACSLSIFIFLYVVLFIYLIPFWVCVQDHFTGNIGDQFGSESNLFMNMLLNRANQSAMFQKYAYYTISTSCKSSP